MTSPMPNPPSAKDSASSSDTAAQAVTDEMLRAADVKRRSHGMSYQAFTMPVHELRSILEAAISVASPPPSAAGATQDCCTIKNMVGNSLDLEMHLHLLGDNTAGPLGKLTGEIYDVTVRAKKAGDERLLSFARWAHERVCLTRYEIAGKKWPTDREMPPQPVATSAASMRERAAKVADKYQAYYWKDLPNGTREEPLLEVFPLSELIRALPDGEG